MQYDFNFIKINFNTDYDDEIWKFAGHGPKALCLLMIDEDGDEEKIFINNNFVFHVDKSGCVLDANAHKVFHQDDRYRIELLKELESPTSEILKETKKELARELI